jgi:hypothetical protein
MQPCWCDEAPRQGAVHRNMIIRTVFCINLRIFRFVRNILKSDYLIRLVCVYARPPGATRLSRDGFSLNFISVDCWQFEHFEVFDYNLKRITGTFVEDQFAFMVIFHRILLRMRWFEQNL